MQRVSKCAMFYLCGKTLVLLLFFRSKRVPPLAEYLTDGAVVLVGVTLMYQRAVTFAEYHEGVHWPPDVVANFTLQF